MDKTVVLTTPAMLHSAAPSATHPATQLEQNSPQFAQRLMAANRTAAHR
jgi:hypothetical protein